LAVVVAKGRELLRRRVSGALVFFEYRPDMRVLTNQPESF